MLTGGVFAAAQDLGPAGDLLRPEDQRLEVEMVIIAVSSSKPELEKDQNITTLAFLKSLAIVFEGLFIIWQICMLWVTFQRCKWAHIE